MSQAEYSRRWRQAHPAEMKVHRQNTALKRLAFVRAAKDQPCADCGKWYSYWVMDFDHVRGVKAFAISVRMVVRVSMARLEAEIAKCDVVCANCHRDRTHSRGAE